MLLEKYFALKKSLFLLQFKKIKHIRLTDKKKIILLISIIQQNTNHGSSDILILVVRGEVFFFSAP